MLLNQIRDTIKHDHTRLWLCDWLTDESDSNAKDTNDQRRKTSNQ